MSESQAIRTGDTVQTLDGVTGGGATALRLAGGRLATPYLNDTQFYHHVADPLIQSYRRDFLARLAAGPPRFILDVPEASRPRGPGTAGFSELSAFIAANYRTALDGGDFIIYERRDASTP